jgi:ABC-type transport system involved in cytochrome bd biosynthesis fused ATPase/permease subunit
MRPTLLGKPVPRATLAWAASATLVSALLRLVYPLAAVLFGHERPLPGSLLVVGALGLSSLRAQLVLATTARLRRLLYDALGAAIHRFPVLAARGLPSRAQVENEIARGMPAVEMFFSETAPSMLGSLLALPVVAWLAARQVGARAVALAALAASAGMLVAVVLGRVATRRGAVAWAFYQRIARLLEEGFAGRAELRVHQLTDRHQRTLLDDVDRWTDKVRAVRALQSLVVWSIPIVAAGVAIALSWAAGRQPAAIVTATLVDPRRAHVLAWAIGIAALPLMTSVASGVSGYANARPYHLAFERFVERATDPAPTSDASRGALGLIEIDAEYAHPPLPGEPAVTVSVRLEWAPGELLAVTGPNGSGKSTLSLLLMGIVRPTRGAVRVTLDGRVQGAEALAGRLGYLPQVAYFDETGSVRDAIRFVAPEASDADALELSSRLHRRPLDAAWLDRPSSALSSGQRRTLALVRVLLRDADVLVLDEPEANLDVGTRREAIALVREIARRKRVMLLTHDPEFSAAADRIVRFGDDHRLAG